MECDLDSHNLFTSETDCTILAEDVDLSFEELYGDELEFLNIGSKEISPILGHIPLLENDCGLELHFLDLDPIPELIPTPEPSLDLSHFPESVLVPVLPESKSTVLSFHTPFWNEVVDKFDSKISCGI